MLIKGTVEGMRPVTGTYRDGKKQGQTWSFLSLEVNDATSREVCSCQLRHDDPAFKEYVDLSGDEPKLLNDITGHEVKMTVIKFSAGERSILQQVVKTPEAEGEKSIRYAPAPVVVVRFQVKNIRDLGLPKDDDED